MALQIETMELDTLESFMAARPEYGNVVMFLQRYKKIKTIKEFADNFNVFADEMIEFGLIDLIDKQEIYNFLTEHLFEIH